VRTKNKRSNSGGESVRRTSVEVVYKRDLDREGDIGGGLL